MALWTVTENGWAASVIGFEGRAYPDQRVQFPPIAPGSSDMIVYLGYSRFDSCLLHRRTDTRRGCEV